MQEQRDERHKELVGIFNNCTVTLMSEGKSAKLKGVWQNLSD